MKKSKRVIAVLMAMATTFAGVFLGTEGNAIQVVEQKVFYETGDIQAYWEEKVAPVKEGYVFGGWFQAENEEN